MINWIKGTVCNMIVTLNKNYITLNNSAAGNFLDYKWCIIGIDDEKKQLVIKAISKNDIDLHLYPTENLTKLNFGNGYIRIANKNMMQALEKIIIYPLESNTKYSASFDENENMLIVDLSRKGD